MSGLFAHIRRADEGATAVEMAVVMMAMLFLIFGTIEFALAYWNMHEMLLATQATGRWVMINHTDANLQADAETVMQQYMPGPSSTGCASPTAGQYCVNAALSGNNTMTLTASYGFNVIAITGNFTLAGQTTVPLD